MPGLFKTPSMKQWLKTPTQIQTIRRRCSAQTSRHVQTLKTSTWITNQMQNNQINRIKTTNKEIKMILKQGIQGKNLVSRTNRLKKVMIVIDSLQCAKNFHRFHLRKQTPNTSVQQAAKMKTTIKKRKTKIVMIISNIQISHRAVRMIKHIYRGRNLNLNTAVF